MENRAGTKKKELLILGGYGSTGRPLAELLLQETEANLILAGRHIDQAHKLASELNKESGDRRVRGISLDAANSQNLREAFQGIDMVVVASSTAEFSEQTATAALEANIDYFDVNFSRHKLAALKKLAPQIEAAGRCFITDGGFHPGLPAALIRHLAPQFDSVDSAKVGSVIKIDWASLELAASTKEEFAGEFVDMEMASFKDGQWTKSGYLSMMKPEYMDFECELAPSFGRPYCIPMFLEEMRAVPRLYPEIKNAGFYVGGFNWAVDWFISPLVMVVLKIWPRQGRGPMGRLLFWGLEKFSRPPYGTLLKAEVEGWKGESKEAAELILYHEDGYAFTAVPAAACLLQYLDGSIRKPGLWLQALIVDPDRLMLDMERMGIAVEYRYSTGQRLAPAAV